MGWKAVGFMLRLVWGKSQCYQTLKCRVCDTEQMPRPQARALAVTRMEAKLTRREIETVEYSLEFGRTSNAI